MKRFMDAYLPREFPGLEFICIPHEGKSDLEKSLPRKLRAWREPGVRFLVIRDSDGSPPGHIEHNLCQICAGAGRPDAAVRLAYQELEAWYLGDVVLLGVAYGKDLSREAGKGTYRDPDSIGAPSALVKKLIPEFQKTDGARRLGALLEVDQNRSVSFREVRDAIAEQAG